MLKKGTVAIIGILAAAAVLGAALGYREERHRKNIREMFSESYESQTADGPDTIAARAESDKALIIFTFDDGNESDYLIAYPILSKYGIKGTSFINPYDADNNVVNKLSWSEIKQMSSNGWDFEDHTYDHIPLKGAAEDVIKRSIEMVDNSFERNGLKAPCTLAYPYGNYDQAVIEVVKQYRKQARLAGNENGVVFVNADIDPYRIQCVDGDFDTEGQLKALESIVDEACLEKAVVVFRMHCMYKDAPGDMGNQPVQTGSKMFSRLVEYCVKKGCGFTTMEGLWELYGNS